MRPIFSAIWELVGSDMYEPSGKITSGRCIEEENDEDDDEIDEASELKENISELLLLGSRNI